MINKIIDFLLTKVMRNDLMKHFFIGTIFTLILYFFNVEPVLIIFLSAVLGAIREVFMAIKKGSPMSSIDLVYTIAPSILFLITL